MVPGYDQFSAVLAQPFSDLLLLHLASKLSQSTYGGGDVVTTLFSTSMAFQAFGFLKGRQYLLGFSLPDVILARQQ